MRFLSFLPYFRTRQARTIRIRRVRSSEPAVAITFYTAAALGVFGLLTAVFVLLGLAGGTILEQSGAIANPGLLAAVLSAHACAATFALNRNAH